MITGFKRTINSKLLMLWTLIFPGVMSVMYDETALQYSGRVLSTFILFIVLETIIGKMREKNTQE